MKLAIAAIGKPGRGPEAALADDYARRATLAGRPLGLGPLELLDLEPRKSGKAPEAELILAAAEGAHLIACDERGKTYASRAFATIPAETSLAVTSAPRSASAAARWPRPQAASAIGRPSARAMTRSRIPSSKLPRSGLASRSSDAARAS